MTETKTETREKIDPSQKASITFVLTRPKMENAHRAAAPMAAGIGPNEVENLGAREIDCRISSLVGSLIEVYGI